MANTLAEIVAKHAKPAPAPTSSAPDANPLELPWRVYVVNPRRQPPAPKYVFGFATEAEANAERDLRQLAEDVRVNGPDGGAGAAERRRTENRRLRNLELPEKPEIEPFAFYVVAMPEEGWPT